MAEIEDPERFRIVGDPSLTDDARVYEVLSPDEVNPDYPVRYRLDLTLPTAPVLTVDQPGPFLDPPAFEEIFIDLDTLVRLGELAAALRDTP